MRNYFTFGGIDSRTYGVYISGDGVFDSPERQYEYINVPGRNGALIGLEKRMNNVSLTYPAFIYESFDTNLSGLKAALLSKIGYQELSDSYHTDEFRLAAFDGDMKVNPDHLRAGKFDLTFNCKPQRFLNSGKTKTTITATGTKINNPTLFDSQPEITVTGYGTLYIGTQGIEIANVWTSVVIDSELADCYSGVNNANGQVTFSTNDFPVLKPGDNNITFDNTITKVEIVPRWWRV